MNEKENDINNPKTKISKSAILSFLFSIGFSVLNAVIFNRKKERLKEFWLRARNWIIYYDNFLRKACAFSLYFFFISSLILS